MLHVWHARIRTSNYTTASMQYACDNYIATNSVVIHIARMSVAVMGRSISLSFLSLISRN